MKIVILLDIMQNYSVTSIIGGVILWTFLEYSLHRWVFHLDAAHGNPYVCTFHFLLHGLHHKVSMIFALFCHMKRT